MRLMEGYELFQEQEERIQEEKEHGRAIEQEERIRKNEKQMKRFWKQEERVQRRIDQEEEREKQDQDDLEAEGRIWLGRRCEEEEQYDEAAELFKSVIDQEPPHGKDTESLACSSLGFLLKMQGQNDEAIVLIRKAAELYESPEKWVLRNIELGKLLKKQKKYEEAEKHYKLAAEQNDNLKVKANVWLCLSELYKEQGKYEEAEKYLNFWQLIK